MRDLLEALWCGVMVLAILIAAGVVYGLLWAIPVVVVLAILRLVGF